MANLPAHDDVVTLYRIIRAERPVPRDFLSNRAKGKTPRDPTPEVLRLWDGLSMYDSYEQARHTARTFPRLGRFIAMVRLSMGGTVRYEQTGASERGHFTVWGDPAELLSLVVSVAAVEPLH